MPPPTHGSAKVSWRKLGLVFAPDGRYPWMHSHAQLPVADVREDGHCRVYFASRTADQRSHIGYADVHLADPTTVRAVSTEPVLAPGPVGYFDEHGVYPAAVVHVGARIFLYYIGWNRGTPPPLFYAAIGLAVSDDGGRTFTRYTPAPIMARGPHDPCLVTSPYVWRTGDAWRMIYVSGVKWEWHGEALRSFYHLKYAESADGIAWRRDGRVAIDFQTPAETNIARASVLEEMGVLKMWYCYVRGTQPYRMGYAESTDGLTWVRRDAHVGIDVSADGFDSAMLCYPNVVTHHGSTYMFYNGNDYGKAGFGLAVRDVPSGMR